MENNLPEGWVDCDLNEIADIILGQSPPSSTYNTNAKGLPFFQGKSEFTNLHPEVRKWCTEPNKIAESNDILLSVRAPIGPTNIANLTCGIGRGLAAIRYKYCFKYIFYFLRNIEKELEKHGTGSTFTAITGDVVKEIQVPLPPLPEQHRIVAKLDALMERVERNKLRLDKIPALLKRFRQSVLAAAVRGRLTEGWRNENPVTGVAQYKEFNATQLEGNDELPMTWQWISVENFLINLDKGRVPISQDLRKKRMGEYPYYGATGIIDYIDGYTHEGEVILISEDGMNLLYRTKPQSIIATGKFWVNNHAHVLKVKDGFQNQYVTFCFNTIDITPFLTGIDQVKLTQKNLNQILLPIPPKEEQFEIVRRVEQLFAFADKIETRYTKVKAMLDRLPQSILAKAFKGDLVPQDPSDEPAAVLLERIKAEKTTTDKSKKKRL